MKTIFENDWLIIELNINLNQIYITNKITNLKARLDPDYDIGFKLEILSR